MYVLDLIHAQSVWQWEFTLWAPLKSGMWMLIQLMPCPFGLFYYNMKCRRSAYPLCDSTLLHRFKLMHLTQGFSFHKWTLTLQSYISSVLLSVCASSCVSLNLFESNEGSQHLNISVVFHLSHSVHSVST